MESFIPSFNNGKTFFINHINPSRFSFRDQSPILLVFLLNKKIAIYAPVYFGNADYHNSVKAQEKFPMRFQFFAGVKLFLLFKAIFIKNLSGKLN